MSGDEKATSSFSSNTCSSVRMCCGRFRMQSKSAVGDKKSCFCANTIVEKQPNYRKTKLPNIWKFCTEETERIKTLKDLPHCASDVGSSQMLTLVSCEEEKRPEMLTRVVFLCSLCRVPPRPRRCSTAEKTLTPAPHFFFAAVIQMQPCIS